jgi:hypothetical protein
MVTIIELRYRNSGIYTAPLQLRETAKTVP